jgi:hypothetical protein
VGRLFAPAIDRWRSLSAVAGLLRHTRGAEEGCLQEMVVGKTVPGA